MLKTLVIICGVLAGSSTEQCVEQTLVDVSYAQCQAAVPNVMAEIEKDEAGDGVITSITCKKTEE